MLTIGVIIGIYSYLIFLLGVAGWIYIVPVILLTVITMLVFAFYILKKRSYFFAITRQQFSLYEKILFVVFVSALLINLVGVLGPELAFDALWYHLPIPKLFIENHSIYFIKDSLFYYSLMPKLTEMLYIPSLLMWSEQGAKLTHFVFGVFTTIVVFRILRLFLSRSFSLLGALIFYSSPVVSWLSITAYSDLSRSFYETLALYYFLLFTKKNQSKNLLWSAIMMGFAICTKVVSIGTIPVYVLMILLCSKLSMVKRITFSGMYVLTAILLAAPWLAYSYFHTGNPFYPLFTHLTLRNFTPDLLSPVTLIKTLIETLLFAPDPLHPFYVMCIPFIFLALGFLFKKNKLILVYTVTSFLVWYFTTQSGGTRFLTSYLPVYTAIGLVAIQQVKDKFVEKLTLLVIFVICVVSISYRGVANMRYVPFLFGFESKQEFLLNQLNFSFGDFYDEDQKIKEIVGGSRVLLVNMHNLFYVDFEFTLDRGDPAGYEYVLVQRASLPEKFKKASKVYENDKTGVILYKL